MASVSTDTYLESLTRAYSASQHCLQSQSKGWLLVDQTGFATCDLLSLFEKQVRAQGGFVATGACREGLIRPFEGILDLVDELAETVYPFQPELLRRYGSTLKTLLPRWREAVPLRNIGELRSGLANFFFHRDRSGIGDYFRRRNAAPAVIADLVHFTLDAAAAIYEDTGSPVVFRLESLNRADSLTIHAVRLLNHYAWRVPVLICATAYDLPKQNASLLLSKLPGWHIIQLDDAINEKSNGPWHQEQFGPDLQALMQPASTLVFPFQATVLRDIVPGHVRGAETEMLEALVEGDIFRRIGQSRFAFSHAKVRETVYDGLIPEQRQQLHSVALNIESFDSFASAWHAYAAGLPGEIGKHTLQAIKRAWALSACDCAIALVERVLESSDKAGIFDSDVLLALLHYEASRYKEAQEFLLSALDRQNLQAIDRTTLKQLTGYNAIFGIKDFEFGKQILETVLRDYLEQGREQEAGYVRNSIAFALLQSGKLDEALDLESFTLDFIKNSKNPDSFLLTILHLNIGRLYRSLGISERALFLFKNGIKGQNSELSPYLRLRNFL